MNDADRDRLIFDARLHKERMERAVARAGFPDFLHELAASELADRLSMITRAFAETVVMSDWPGSLPSRLRQSGRHDRVTIVSQAANGHVVASHELPPLKDQTIDCLVSVLSLHAVNDLPGALLQYRRALKADGVFIACMLGEGSLGELRQAWLSAEADTARGASPRVAPFAGTRELGGLLQRAGFALPVVDSDRTVVRYASALDAMREVKALGWSNALRARSCIPVSRRLLARAAACYDATFAGPDGRVPLSLNLVYLTGWAPHESQQKPLKPGSARMRLAEALKVPEHRLKDDTASDT